MKGLLAKLGKYQIWANDKYREIVIKFYFTMEIIQNHLIGGINWIKRPHKRKSGRVIREAPQLSKGHQ